MSYAESGSKLLRKFEMLSLVLSIIGWPLLFFAFPFYLISENTITIMDVEFFMFFFTGFLAIFILGYLFGIPLKHYFNKEETKKDINNARISFFSVFSFIFLLFFFIFLQPP